MQELKISSFEIRELAGSEAATVVLPLYSSEGNGISIHATDLFFVGFLDGHLVGSVRFCVEDRVPLLRTMRIAQKFQRQGYGERLLKYFESHLVRNHVKSTYCIPYTHLENFYGRIGFKMANENLIPDFLRKRLAGYRTKSESFICMVRP